MDCQPAIRETSRSRRPIPAAADRHAHAWDVTITLPSKISNGFDGL